VGSLLANPNGHIVQLQLSKSQDASWGQNFKGLTYKHPEPQRRGPLHDPLSLQIQTSAVMSPLSNILNQNKPSSSNYGDDSLADKEALKTGILADLKGMGADLPKDVLTAIEALESALNGEPVDDKKLMVRFHLSRSVSRVLEVLTFCADGTAYTACGCDATLLA
jgi:hypothetical protein